MKRKKLGILAITYLLLGVIIATNGSSQTLNVKQMAEDTLNHEPLPDLKPTIEILDLNLNNFKAYFYIHNQGEAVIPEGATLTCKIIVPETHYWKRYELSEALEPGEKFRCVIPFSHFNKIRDRGEQIIIIADPIPTEHDDYPWPELNPDPKHGLINESEETNNENAYTIKLSRSKSQNLFYRERLLFSITNKLFDGRMFNIR